MIGRGTPHRRILAGYFRRHAVRYAAGVGLLLATNALALWIPWLLKQAIETLSEGRPERSVAGLATSRPMSSSE